MNGDGQNPLAVLLADDVLIELRNDLAGRGDAGEERFRRAAAALFLFQNRLAQVDTLAADVNVAGPFDERANVAVALATERTEGVLLGRAGAASAAQVLSSGHGHSLVFQLGGLLLEGCRRIFTRPQSRWERPCPLSVERNYDQQTFGYRGPPRPDRERAPDAGSMARQFYPPGTTAASREAGTTAAACSNLCPCRPLA